MRDDAHPLDRVRHLFAADRLRHDFEARTPWVRPAGAGTLNLFLCVYLEQYLRNDPSGAYLSLFLFIEVSLHVLASIAYFNEVTREIMQHSSIFRVSPPSRLLFAVGTNLRRPLILSLHVTTLLFFFVLFEGTALSVAFGSYILLMTTAVCGTASLCLYFSRTTRSLSGLPALLAIATAGGAAVSMLLAFRTVVSVLPVSAWGAAAIVTARQGNFPAMAAYCIAQAATASIVIFIGRKIS